jgi:hypothetical protein
MNNGLVGRSFGISFSSPKVCSVISHHLLCPQHLCIWALCLVSKFISCVAHISETWKSQTIENLRTTVVLKPNV